MGNTPASPGFAAWPGRAASFCRVHALAAPLQRGWRVTGGASTPIFLPAVSQLPVSPRHPGLCSSSAGALPAPFWAPELWPGLAQVLAEGSGWAVGPRRAQGARKEQEAPGAATTGTQAPSPRSHHAGHAASRLRPLVTSFCLRDAIWQGISLEINSDDIPVNAPAQTGRFV